MTTIAYRAGVMASDSRAYSGGSTPIGNKIKIRLIENIGLIGVSTTVPGLSEQVFAWAESDFSPDYRPEIDGPNLSILWIDLDGAVYLAFDSYHFTGPLDGEFFAIGSGDHYALGAMQMGASAQTALEVACALDVWTDGTIRTLSLEKNDVF